MKVRVPITCVLWLLCCSTLEAADQQVPPPGVLRVATCQFPIGADMRANAEWIRTQMREARERGADIAHFPESALPGYIGADYRSNKGFDWALLRQETESIIALADELNLWVVLGSMHRLSGQNKPHNCLYLIDPEGKVVDRYDKRFCTRGDLHHYSPGDHFVTFDVNGVRCGLLICYDLGFPELYRQYAKLDVRMMLHSFYNARSEKNVRLFTRIAPILAQAHAISNNMFVSMSNSSAPYSWTNHMIAPDAIIMGKLPTEKPGVMVNTVDIRRRYKDSTRSNRKMAIDGKLNSGSLVDDPRSKDRTSF